MVTNNVTVYQFEVGLDEVFADEVRFRVNVDCVIVVVVHIQIFSFIWHIFRMLQISSCHTINKKDVLITMI